MHSNSVITKIEEIINFKKPIIYLDIEASRAKTKLSSHKILQIGAVLVENNQIMSFFNEWSNPEENIDPRILKLVQRNQSFFLNKPKNIVVYKSFLNFIEGVEQIIVFGNFDSCVLNSLAQKYHLPKIDLLDIQAKFFDKILEANHVSVSLKDAATALKVYQKSTVVHNAKLDAEKLYNVIQKIQKCYYPDLKKLFLFEMITPRKKEYTKTSIYYRKKIHINLNQDFLINYFSIKKKWSYSFSEEKNETIKHLTEINCSWKNFFQNGQIIDQVNYKKSFSLKNESTVNVFLLNFYEAVLNKIDFNSIFIMKESPKLFWDLYFKKQHYYLEYYYIPKIFLELYLKNFENVNNLENFFQQPAKIKKIFDLLRRKKLFINEIY